MPCPSRAAATPTTLLPQEVCMLEWFRLDSPPSPCTRTSYRNQSRPGLIVLENSNQKTASAFALQVRSTQLPAKLSPAPCGPHWHPTMHPAHAPLSRHPLTQSFSVGELVGQRRSDTHVKKELVPRWCGLRNYFEGSR